MCRGWPQALRELREVKRPHVHPLAASAEKSNVLTSGRCEISSHLAYARRIGSLGRASIDVTINPLTLQSAPASSRPAIVSDLAIDEVSPLKAGEQRSLQC